MNTLTKITVFITLLILTLFTTTSCMVEGFTGIKGNRNVISEDRSISSNFENIKVQQGIHLYLTQGETTTVKVEADENIMDLLVTEVNNNELKIYFDKNVYKAKARNVYLTTSNIAAISTSSGAYAKTENTIRSESITLKSSSGSSIRATIDANNVDSSCSSGADIDIFGKTKTFSAKASSGSSIDADELKSTDAYAKVSSGANIDVNVTGKLTAKASSGGDIDFEGNPSEVNKETSSGGSVSGS
ncbi:Putative auto-transporter adhesin, head GIN domain [Lutibacter oricola]|uniref:Putative auto-transporter adhesin, head GIN domain n=1 Tax=Lutibacter oricola TaxID=762486 RepID=A0A1H2Z7S5_9FLAO|nr:head GIN domain-containing protein [Lutibacter oricola]SDX13048.1 Putative auto-transporter adhesin, head GIN domain [Lutibacter oricola]